MAAGAETSSGPREEKHRRLRSERQRQKYRRRQVVHVHEVYTYEFDGDAAGQDTQDVVDKNRVPNAPSGAASTLDA